MNAIADQDSADRGQVPAQARPSFFDSFTPKEIATISARGRRLTLPAQWSPIAESTPADKAYILLDGEMSVRRHGEEIARLGAGDIVGEMAIVNHALRSASIVTLTPSVVLHLTSEDVLALAEEIPAFARALGSAAADRSPAA